MNEKEATCSFCGRVQTKRLLANESEDAFICDECVLEFQELFQESKPSPEKMSRETLHLLPPVELKKALDNYVIGQDLAKKSLSVAVYGHYQRLLRAEKNRGTEQVEISKSNILLIGPTGSGKTLLAETLAKILQVPFVLADATSLTEAGYVGDDVETMLQKLLYKCDYDIKRAEQGIIYLDEIDKIARKGENMSITRDVSGEGVQQALLKIIEGTTARVPVQGNRKHAQQECVEINTRQILFICGGAFDGLEKIVRKRSDQHSIGFTAPIFKNSSEKRLTNLLKKVAPEDLVKYGLIPEFVGRLPLVCVLEELQKADLVKILIEPKNALIRQYQELFALDGIELVVTKEALQEIAEQALKQRIGARGLRSILEKLLLETRFRAPSIKGLSRVIVNQAVVKGELAPILEKNEEMS